MTYKEMDTLLVKEYKKSVFSTNFLFVFLCLVFPVSIFASSVIYGSGGFGAWIWIFALWCLVFGLIVMIMPIVDFRAQTKKAALQKEQEAANKRRVSLKLEMAEVKPEVKTSQVTPSTGAETPTEHHTKIAASETA